MIKRLISFSLLIISYQAFSQSTTQRYIETHKEKAMEMMSTHGVPASIVLGVAIHESGSGTSKISRYLNNHFGIKGPNSSKEIRSAYRGFDDSEDSFDYFVGLLHSKPKFKPLFDKFTHYDYKGWARGIQRGGYAASRTWASQVIAIINKYDLHALDNRPADYQEPAEKASLAKAYFVKQGDTLNAIAKRFQLSTKSLILKNQLRSTVIHIGQKLEL